MASLTHSLTPRFFVAGAPAFFSSSALVPALPLPQGGARLRAPNGEIPPAGLQSGSCKSKGVPFSGAPHGALGAARRKSFHGPQMGRTHPKGSRAGSAEAKGPPPLLGHHEGLPVPPEREPHDRGPNGASSSSVKPSFGLEVWRTRPPPKEKPSSGSEDPPPVGLPRGRIWLQVGLLGPVGLRQAHRVGPHQAHRA